MSSVEAETVVATPQGRRIATPIVVVCLLLPVVMGSIAFVYTLGKPTGSAVVTTAQSLALKGSNSTNGTYYLLLSLANMNETDLELVSVGLQSHSQLELPLVVPAYPPITEDILCKSPAHPDASGLLASRITDCHGETGYWYAIITDPTGGVRAIYFLQAPPYYPGAASAAWAEVGTEWQTLTTNETLVIVTTLPLDRSGGRFVVVMYDEGETATLPVPESGMIQMIAFVGLPTLPTLCPSGTSGHAEGLNKTELPFAVGQRTPLGLIALSIQGANLSLSYPSGSGDPNCVSLARTSASSPSWFAVLENVSGVTPTTMASFGDVGGSVGWSSFPVGGPLPTLQPNGTYQIQMDSLVDLVGISEQERLILTSSSAGSVLSWGGSLSNLCGCVYQ